MYARILFGSLLGGALLSACAEQEPLSPPVPGRDVPNVEIETRAAGRPVSIYVFRQGGDGFRFDTLLGENWPADGRLRAALPRGEYRFLFAGGADGVKVSPEPLLPGTALEAFGFEAVEDGQQGYVLLAGELFLQSPAGADSVYRVGNEVTSVSGRLTRAVGRVDVVLKRGYRDGDSYVPVPYAEGENILRHFASVELDIAGVGTRVTPWESAGEARVRTVLDAAAGELSPEGFASLEGPYVIPPQGEGELTVTLTLNRPAGDVRTPVSSAVRGKLGRNERLEIVLWLDVAEPTVGVTVRTEPMSAVADGDTGIWE